MRGADERSGSLFSYVDLEARVRGDHPLRRIRRLVNAALSDLSRAFDDALYRFWAAIDRTGEVATRDVAAGVLRYPHRAPIMERLEFDLLFRWFVGLGVDDPVWDHSVFSKNRDRLLEGEIAAKFLSAVLAQPRVKRLCRAITFGGRHADRGLGVDQELPQEGWKRQRHPEVRAATLSATSTRRSAQTRHTKARPTRKRGFTRRATGSRPSFATWGMP